MLSEPRARADAPPRARTPAREARRTESLAVGLFLLPSLGLIAVFSVYPPLYAIYLSLTNAALTRLTFEFVGLANFVEFFTEASSWMVLKNSFVYVGVVIFFQFTLGLGFALVLNGVRRGRGLYGALLFLPWVFSEVVAVTSWRWIFNDSFGLLNYYLGQLGLGRPGWFAEPGLAMVTVIVLTVWKGYPFSMVLQLAGLQTIPQDVYESARVDGASGWQLFRFITVPLMKFVIIANIMLITIYTFNVFSLVFAMTGGGPVNATEIMGIHMYKKAFETGRLGYGSAVAVLMFLINVGITIVYLRTLARRGMHADT